MTDPTATPDPMPAGKLGMILFLSAEGMFFLGLLSAMTVLEPGNRALFHRAAATMNGWGFAGSILLLVVGSATLLPKARRRWQPIVAIACGGLFVLLQLWICRSLVRHETIVARVDHRPTVFDGVARRDKSTIELTGTAAPLPAGFDPHDVVLPPGGVPGVYTIPADAVLDAIAYGPSRNNYFGCYFTLTGAHLAHLLGGILVMGWLTLRSRSNRWPAAETYWHCVNAVGVVSLVLLWWG